MFENFHVYETEFAGKKISFETGKMCCLAGGSVLVRYGETTVLVNATASKKPRDGIDFLPCRWTLRKNSTRWARSPAPS